MRRSVLFASTLTTLALLVTGCQGGGSEHADAATQTAGTTNASACNLLGRPTVVRYRSHEPQHTEHAVHLLAGDATTARANGCTEQLPVASVVTLRYRTSGG